MDWKTPKSVRQIGDVKGRCKIYVEEIDLVIFAAKEYSKENASDRTSMMYSRTFLENDIYLDYQDKFKKYKVYLKEQEELDEIRKKLKMKDGYEW